MLQILNEILNVMGLGIGFGILYTFEPYVRLIDTYLPYKPFNCVLCMSFWISIVIYVFVGFNPIYAFYTSLLAEGVYRRLVS